MNKNQCIIYVIHKICNEELIYLKYRWDEIIIEASQNLQIQ